MTLERKQMWPSMFFLCLHWLWIVRFPWSRHMPQFQRVVYWLPFVFVIVIVRPMLPDIEFSLSRARCKHRIYWIERHGRHQVCRSVWAYVECKRVTKLKGRYIPLWPAVSTLLGSTTLLPSLIVEISNNRISPFYHQTMHVSLERISIGTLCTHLQCFLWLTLGQHYQCRMICAGW